ncbi:hypothetical protein ES708_30075 [subsurface metagenome]
MTKPVYGEGAHKCQRCGGRAPFNEEEQVYKCLNCGHEELELRAYYQRCEEQKKEILNDIQVLGPVKTRDKYQMPMAAWRRICVKWGLRKVWVYLGSPSPSKDGLRQLPAFRHGWSDELKIKWLDTYQAYLEVSKERR